MGDEARDTFRDIIFRSAGASETLDCVVPSGMLSFDNLIR